MDIIGQDPSVSDINQFLYNPMSVLLVHRYILTLTITRVCKDSLAFTPSSNINVRPLAIYYDFDTHEKVVGYH